MGQLKVNMTLGISGKVTVAHD